MKRGEITVFFALLLSAVCVFFCAVIESARTQAMRFQIETLMDMGLHSCFGEYQQELFARYDLLYIDTSYGRESGDITKTLRHLEQYIEENAGSGKAGAQTLLQEKGDWFQLSIEKSEAVQFLLASDFNGHTLRNQAVHYIRVYGDSSHSAAMAKTA
ncbi:MAG TPA: hypothetical protein PLU43_11020, partial [Lachnospiraceae bacterium]|nr:hypothetical protein [Lachnospiraceae bacterium]